MTDEEMTQLAINTIRTPSIAACLRDMFSQEILSGMAETIRNSFHE